MECVSIIRTRSWPSAIHTANEQGVAGENSTVIAIFKEVADTVLSMAGCVQRLHCNAIANRERLAMAGGLGDFCAVLAADDGKRKGLENLGVTTGVVVVAGIG